MKKRIIATILLLVMVLATFASCGSYKFSDEKNFDEYAYVKDYEAFLAALKNIVVEDEDFAITANRDQLVKLDIYGDLADVFYKDADRKLTEGEIGDTDVAEYYYYCTVTVDGKEYTFDYAKMLTASSMKLPLIDEDSEEISKKIKETLNAATLVKDGNYKVITSSGTTVKNGETIVVSYTESWAKYNAGNDTQNPDGTSDKDVKVSYAVITLDTTKALDYHLVNGKKTGETTHDTANRPSIGTNYKKTFSLESTDGEGVKTVTTYTDFTIHGRIDKVENGSTFDYKLTEEKKVNVNGVTEEITLAKDTVVTYHVYPTARVEVPMDVTAEQIVRHILGKNIKSSSVTIFASEDEVKYTYTVMDYDRYAEDEGDHKKGDIKYDADGKIQYVETKGEDGQVVTKEATLKEIVDALAKEYANDATKAYAEVEAVKTAKAAYDAAEEAYKTKETEYNTAKAAYDAAKKVVDDAGENATQEQKDALAAAETAKKDAETAKSTANTAKNNAKTALTKAQDDTKAAKVEVLTLHLLGCTRVDGENTVTVLADIEEAYTKQTYRNLETTHDTNLTEKIGKAVWDVIVENVEIKLDHPALEKVIKRYTDHLYEQYEYDYYKGKETDSVTGTSVSNYSKYDSLEEFMVAKLEIKSADKIDEKLAENAKEILKDQLIVYAAAKALDVNNADANYRSWIEASEADLKKMYEHSINHDGDMDADEVTEKVNEAYQSALDSTDDLLVTNKVFKEYKKELGRAQYNLYVDSYGEENLRMNLQFSKLMSFLLYTDYEADENADHEGEYKVAYADGKLAYRFIEYKLQSEVDAETPVE